MGAVELWQEKAFELLLDGRWISERFDRVVVTRDAEGRPTDVAVIDVKVQGSHTVERDLRKQHGSQMDTYRSAAARLLGLSESRVSVLLLVLETEAPDKPRLVVM